jgi:phenylacetate-CoA ligase
VRQPPFWVWNAALNQLYMSSYHLAPDLIPYYLNALSHYRIRYLYGYSSSLYELAQAAIRLGSDDQKMEVVLTNAEPLFDYQRRAIEKAFGCPVRETYGMAEIAVAASECGHGGLHLWPDVGHTEVHDETGDLLCTGLLNDDMPLIRYRVGDRVRPGGAEVSCACGRTLPQIAAIEGRLDDVLVTRDGRRIGRLDPVFKTELPVREAQIIQEAIDRIRIRYVPEDGFTNQTGELLTKRLQAHLGNVDVVLEALDRIPRTANGKFRAVVSQLL